MLRLFGMMMGLAAIPFALAPIGASGAGSAGAAASDGPVSCDIQITESAGGIRLQPTALSVADLNGTYEFAVSKSGGGNTATISQGGPFSARAGRPEILSDSSFDARGSLTATLRIHWQGGTLSCEKRYPSA